MVEAQPKTRDQTKQELLTKATNLLNSFESHKLVFEDAARNYVAR